MGLMLKPKYCGKCGRPLLSGNSRRKGICALCDLHSKGALSPLNGRGE